MNRQDEEQVKRRYAEEAQAQTVSGRAMADRDSCDTADRAEPKRTVSTPHHARFLIELRINEMHQDADALRHLLRSLPETYYDSPLAGRLWSKLLRA